MFESGFRYLKREGMTHMSVEKITSSCGIGKSTFYNFFSSKEDFILQLIEYKRRVALEETERSLNGREKMTAEEGRLLFKSINSSVNSIYQYLKLEDLLKLQKTSSYLSSPDIHEETELLCHVLSHIEDVRENPDYGLIANLIKIITLVIEEKEMLHEEAFEKTISVLYDALFANIFKERGAIHEV